MNAAPFVTISIASHNRLPLLKESVASALAQDYPRFEVLVCDDGSGDETRAWLMESAVREERLRVVFRDPDAQERVPPGIAGTRQRGVEEAQGEWVCILDSDDRLVPEALSRIMGFANEHAVTSLIYTNNFHVTDGGQREECRYPVYATNADMTRATFLRPRCPFKHSGTTFRRDTALALGGYDTSLPIKVDIEFFLKFLAAGEQLRLLETPVVEFRMHADSVSKKRWLGIRTYWRLIDRYGPRNPVARLGYKATRAFWELAKGVYLGARFAR